MKKLSKEWQIKAEAYELLHNSYILITCENEVIIQVPCFDNEPAARELAQHIVDQHYIDLMFSR